MLNKGITQSKVFMVLGTKSYFDNIPIKEVMIAKNIGKPFRVLVDIGVKVPKWFSDGVLDYKEMEVPLFENANLATDLKRLDIVDFLKKISRKQTL